MRILCETVTGLSCNSEKYIPGNGVATGAVVAAEAGVFSDTVSLRKLNRLKMRKDGPRGQRNPQLVRAIRRLDAETMTCTLQVLGPNV